jgi:general secretion pathway protein G
MSFPGSTVQRRIEDMKSRIVVTTLFLALVWVGCAKKGPPNTPESGPDSRAPGEFVDGIPMTVQDPGGGGMLPTLRENREAATFALDYWHPTKVGQSHYLYMIETGHSMSGQELRLRSLIELREPTVELQPDRLTEPDKLNGVEWRGAVNLRAKAGRSFLIEDKREYIDFGAKTQAKASTQWGPWGNNGYTIFCENNRGRWTWKVEWERPARNLQNRIFERVKPSDIDLVKAKDVTKAESLSKQAAALKKTAMAPIREAKAQIQLFQTSLDAYKMDIGSYPTTGPGLEALRSPPGNLPTPSKWKGPYYNTDLPLAPWERPYQYLSPGVHNPDSFDVWTIDPDGHEIGNWQ